MDLNPENKQQEDKTELDIYKKYQENAAKTAEIQAKILKGIKTGKSIYELFLLATEGISILTSNPAFQHQVEEDSVVIYGYGLGEPTVLKQQIEETEKRLSRLKKALEEENNPLAHDRISFTVKAHEDELARLKSKIED